MEELTDQDCLAKQSFVDARDGANRKSFLYPNNYYCSCILLVIKA